MTEDPRTFRVGVYTGLTEEEAKTRFMKSYTSDFYGKPDHVGSVILNRNYPCFLLFLFFTCIGLGIFSYVHWTLFLLCGMSFVLLVMNVIVLIYRCNRYPPFLGI